MMVSSRWPEWVIIDTYSDCARESCVSLSSRRMPSTTFWQAVGRRRSRQRSMEAAAEKWCRAARPGSCTSLGRCADHGRSYFVRHVGEEFCLDSRGVLRALLRLRQLRVGSLELAGALGHQPLQMGRDGGLRAQ